VYVCVAAAVRGEGEGGVEFALFLNVVTFFFENAKKYFHENIGLIILRNPWHQNVNL
jgi:hypothetical protein